MTNALRNHPENYTPPPSQKAEGNQLLSDLEFSKSLQLEPLSTSTIEELNSLAGLTALRQTNSGEFYISNPKRGHLLYQLVRKFKPENILEVGTGRGYGALSMALAARDANLNTRIFSIDMLPPTQPQSWAIDRKDGARVEMLSINEVWGEISRSLTEKISLLTGSSISCLRSWLNNTSSPRIDFAFIDGGHDYWTARHDIQSAIIAAKGGKLQILLDDYDGVQGQDVKTLVNSWLNSSLQSEISRVINMPQSDYEFKDNGPHCMAFFSTESAKLTSGVFPMPILRAAATAENYVEMTKRGLVQALKRLRK